MTGRRSPITTVYAHEAVLELEVDSDASAAAPGAAITVELCGHWKHEGACRWPHHTAVVARAGRVLTVRVLFAAATADRDEARDRVTTGLCQGELTGPSGQVHRWRVIREAASSPVEGEEALVAELARLGARK